MKVLIINGSPHDNGTTRTALAETEGVLRAAGVETEVIRVGGKPISGCLGCGHCRKTKSGCVMNDIVNEVAEKLKEADGLIIGSPVYYASPNGTLLAFLDRLFYSANYDMSMKVGAAVVCARRGGCTAAFEVLNKYFAISGMPIAPSIYWNQVHGAVAEDALLDAEGLATMRQLAKNMVFLMNSIALGKEKFGLPEKEPKARTNFIRR